MEYQYKLRPHHRLCISFFSVKKYSEKYKEHIKKSAEKIFKTETGKKIVKDMFFPETFQKSETWAQDALQDLEDFIEEQGIYIRQ